MNMTDKYDEGDRFLEVTFQIPADKRIFSTDAEIKIVINSVLDRFPDAHNIRVIPCEVRRTPARLVVCKDDSSYSVFNSKQESQIIEDGE